MFARVTPAKWWPGDRVCLLVYRVAGVHPPDPTVDPLAFWCDVTPTSDAGSRSFNSDLLSASLVVDFIYSW